MAARKINLALGFVPMPFRFEKAVEDDKAGTHSVCQGTAEEPHPPARVRNKVTCEACGRVESSPFGYKDRGIEIDGKLVVVDADELRAAQGEPIKTLDITFRPRVKVYGASLTKGSVNYLLPDKGGEKAYRLLSDTLAAHPDWVAIGIWAPVSANTLWVIEAVEGRLVMTSLCWPEDLRLAPAIAPVDVIEQEAAMFEMAAETYFRDTFDATEFANMRKLGREKLVASLMGEAVEITPSAAPVAASVDLMAALQATMDAATPKRPVKPAPAKKTAAKKPAAKKAPAKRAVKKAATPAA